MKLQILLLLLLFFEEEEEEEEEEGEDEEDEDEDGEEEGILRILFNSFVTMDAIAISLFNLGGEFIKQELQHSVGRTQTIRNYSIGCDLL